MHTAPKFVDRSFWNSTCRNMSREHPACQYG